MRRIRSVIFVGMSLLATGSWAWPTSGEGRLTGPATPTDTSRVFDRYDPWQGRASSLRAQAPRPESRLGLSTWGARYSAATQLVADPNLVGTDGNVLSMARSRSTLYIAGSFRSVGENSGGLVPFDAHTGEVLRPFPKVAGSVFAIVPDGSGGWYIGGDFTAIAGKPRFCLAQLRADGSVSDWSPAVTGSPGYIQLPVVLALAVNGDRVFVGGQFRLIGGQPHEDLGCVDATTGAVLDWDLDTARDQWVGVMATRDSTVFVGGGFSSIAGQPRSSLVALNARTGEVLPWRVDVSGSVNALLARDDTLYVGGDFVGIAAQTKSVLAAVDINTAQLLPFDPRASGIVADYRPSPQVDALLLVGDTLYAGGNFTQIGGVPRVSLAALNPTTGDALPWTPAGVGPTYPGVPPGRCWALAVRKDTLYVVGFFWTVGGVSHPCAVALSRQTGLAGAWDPKLQPWAWALAVRGDTVLIGGQFASVGEWRHRAGLAAIDLTTGRLKPWNPNPDGSICTAVVAADNRVFVSGDFANIGGDPQPRNYFAALDTVNGDVVAWDPGANSLANALLLQGDTLYAGGEFTMMGGQPRNYVAAIDAITGAVTTWDPNANWPVYAIGRSDDTVYIGGLFSMVGSKSRAGIAALDAVTGAPTPWDPSTDNDTVKALLVAGSTVYVGGMFGEAGGEGRLSIAALDKDTGHATSWYPQPTAWGMPTEVKALALADGKLYTGGAFGSMGGQPRICLASVDTTDSFATDWDPGADGIVWSLLAAGNTVYVGGGFSRAGGLPCSGLAAFSPPQPPPPVPLPSRLAISGIWPNPARSTVSFRLAMPSSGTVNLDVFDIQGRRIVSVLRHEDLTAGIKDISVRSDGWQPGLYICRLQAEGLKVSRRFLVIR